MANVQLDSNGISVDGEYKILLCASLFYFRIPKEYWQDRIDMLINAGYNCVDVYFPWNYHEKNDNEWDFTLNRDADKFLDMLCKSGLYVIARPGPYICSEWDGGALPARICGGDYNIRTNDKQFLSEVKKWYAQIIPLIAKHQIGNGGGKVILLQLENELDFFDCSDVKGYISALRDMAKDGGINVPMFACAGQSDRIKAGGTVEGVEPTYNFYPDSRDKSYDEVMLRFNRQLAKLNKPLLISETNRDHFLLRRELAAGAKLLGAYNQVAGSNFGFTSSINNWGSPIAFLTTKYDFNSLVSTLGEYNSEINNARELSLFINALGQELGAAVSDNSIDAYCTSNKESRPQKLNVLRLKSGGLLVNAANYSYSELLNISVKDYNFTAAAAEYTAPFLPVDLSLAPFGLDGKINYSANEIMVVDKTHMAFKKSVVCEVSLTYCGKDYIIKDDTKIGGLQISFLSDDGIAKIAGFEKGYIKEHKISAVPSIKIKRQSPEFKNIEQSGRINLEALGQSHGYIEYTAEDFEKGLFLENVADIVTAVIDGEYVSTRAAGGNCQVYQGGKKAKLKVESWGHSNFDDARRQSLRIASKKGICGAYEIMNRYEQKRLKFKLIDGCGGQSVNTDYDESCPLLSVSSWNSTRQPLSGLYSFNAARTSDKLYIRVTDKVETAVYVDGKFAGKGEYEYVDLTSFAPRDKSILISIAYRKANWAENCGIVELFDLRRLDVKTAKLDETDIINQNYSGGEEQTLPYKLVKGNEYLGQIVLSGSECRELRVNIKDAKMTFCAGGVVIGRILGQWDGAPKLTGGSETDFYIPGAWLDKSGGKVDAYIESIGENPEIVNIEQIFKNT